MVEIIRFLITFFQSSPSTDEYSHLIFNFLDLLDFDICAALQFIK